MVLQLNHDEEKKNKSQEDESKDPELLRIHTSLLFPEDYDLTLLERKADFVFKKCMEKQGKDFSRLYKLHRKTFAELFPNFNSSIHNLPKQEREKAIQQHYRSMTNEDRLIYDLAQFKIHIYLGQSDLTYRLKAFKPEPISSLKGAYAKLYNVIEVDKKPGLTEHIKFEYQRYLESK